MSKRWIAGKLIPDLGSGAARREGSSPSSSTINNLIKVVNKWHNFSYSLLLWKIISYFLVLLRFIWNYCSLGAVFPIIILMQLLEKRFLFKIDQANYNLLYNSTGILIKSFSLSDLVNGYQLTNIWGRIHEFLIQYALSKYLPHLQI